VPAAKILVIDDEQSILDLVTAYLSNEGYEFRTAMDGPSGLKAARVFKPDLIVLDIMLPGMDGIELLSQLRRESDVYVIMLTAKSEETDKIVGLSVGADDYLESDVYVIMLTAKSEETDKIVGLSVGADDYLTKPFSPRELMARIKAALRRMRTGESRVEGSVLSFQHIRIDTGGRTISVDDKSVDLTAIEFDLLCALAEHPGIVLSREQLLERVWGFDYFGEIRVVDVHIGHIRQKLGDDRFITTVRGVGYRFEDKVQ